MSRSDQMFMSAALEQANMAMRANEVPVGAVVVADDQIIARAHNCPIESKDPTAHAEMFALRTAAAYLNNYRLPQVTVYVTLEPCAMCFGAMVHARVQRLVFGARDTKSGVLGGVVDWQHAAVFNHQIEILGGVLQEECSALLKQFFIRRRSGVKS